MAAETARSWHEIVLQTLKRNEITLVPYVPDRVLTPLIKNLHADPYFNIFPTAPNNLATIAPSSSVAPVPRLITIYTQHNWQM